MNASLVPFSAFYLNRGRKEKAKKVTFAVIFNTHRVTSSEKE